MLDSHMDERKQFLLRAIVHDYVATAEPVASQVLVERYRLHVKSATVRNEMSEMSEMGLLQQPHTSSGRIPTDRGYRFYVDHLMPVVPGGAEGDDPGRPLAQFISDEIDEVLKQTCRLLTRLTRYMAVATPPETTRPSLREVHLSPLDGRRCLIVLVLPGGEVRHRVLALPQTLPATELTRLSNRLTEQLQGITAETASTLLAAEGEERPEGVFRLLIETVLDLLQPPSAEEVLVAGSRHMLQQPEFRDVSRLQNLLEVLEERRSVLEVLRDAVEDQSVQIIIGEENPEEGLRECSLIAARYSAGPGVHGAIGVIGPTRMAYSTTVPIVELIAQYLTGFFNR